jgi:hypothetical protein
MLVYSTNKPTIVMHLITSSVNVCSLWRCSQLYPWCVTISVESVLLPAVTGQLIPHDVLLASYVHISHSCNVPVGLNLLCGKRTANIWGCHGGEDDDVGLLDSNFSPEDGSSKLLRNVGMCKSMRRYSTTRPTSTHWTQCQSACHIRMV